ncbi:hypothetical protein ACHAWC_010667 [Mediolabrus comicus]
MMLSSSIKARCLAAMAAVVITLFCSSSSPQVFSAAFTVIPSQQLSAAAISSSVDATTKKTTPTILYSSSESSPSSRRSFLSKIITSSSSATLLITSLPTTAHASSSSSKEELLTDLTTSLTKISSIPPLLESAEWDKVRTILKTPPVNQLWNLGESQNTLVKLAKETGNFDLMEVKDELAISLQMTDQYSYDNVFIYYQPGNGKVKTKEPLEMANKAIVQLKEALEMASQSD